MLSLSPRFDLFKFNFPKEFFAEELIDKYNELLSNNEGVLSNCIDYVNESIQGISIPGINAEIVEQQQFEKNPIQRETKGKTGLGRINVEPAHSFGYNNIKNPLELIDKEFKVTFRTNQGLFNYFFLYESMFWALCKDKNNQPASFLYIDLLNESGTIISRIKLTNILWTSIDGLDFTYNQLEREAHTFTVSFRYNNIDFDFLKIEEHF